MTIIIRSDRRAASHLGGINGFTGPMDFVAMLDFAADRYFRVTPSGRIDYTIDDVVQVTRASAGAIQRRDGSLSSVSANRPRLSYIKDRDLSGLLLERAMQNYLTAAPTDGSTVALPASTNRLILSYRGGAASIAGTGLTLRETFVADGRTCQLYERSTASNSATISVSGGAAEVQIVDCPSLNGHYPGLFLGYGQQAQAKDEAKLTATITSLLAGGDFSVVIHRIKNPSAQFNVQQAYPVYAQTTSPASSILPIVADDRTALGTGSITTTTGGVTSSAFAPTSGVWSDIDVNALFVEDYGVNVGHMSFGQYSAGTGRQPVYSGIPDIFIGGGTGRQIGGIITRCVIYNRALTAVEAASVASAWRT